MHITRQGVAVVFVGLLTAPFRGKSLKDIVRFADEHAFGGLEVVTGVGSGHIDAAQVLKDKGRSIKRLLKGTGVHITALARYGNPLEADPQKRDAFLSELRAVIDAAEVLEVPVVCTLAGFPLPGKTKMQTIEQDVPSVFAPLCEYAQKRGVKIALENWFATNLQGLHHFERLFEVVPHENLGLNFDPSHLVHQDIDYIAAVERFASRIFHTHAKDTQIYEHKRRWLGNYESGWWRYVIPGYGVIDWGRYIGTLRRIGYDGVLSIEHEDAAFPVEAGFLRGKAYLSQFV